MQQLFQIMGSIILIIVYILYFKQVTKNESTPNAGTWIIWSLIMTINTFTYLQVVKGEYLKVAIVFVSFISITLVTFYAIFKNKFAKLSRLDLLLLILAIIIGVVWQITDNAILANILIQLVLIISFLPTAIGLLQDRLKEKHLPWTLALIAYVLQTISLTFNYDGNIYQFFLPVINGILGNGLITAILIYKAKKT